MPSAETLKRTPQIETAISRLERAIDRMQSASRTNRENLNPPKLSETWLKAFGLKTR